MILFSREGVYASFGDKILFDISWPWRSSKPSEVLLPSTDFAKCSDRVFGVSVEAPLEVFCSNFLLQNTSYVVISEIDVTSKDKSFWMSLPEAYRIAFINDFVFMRCDTLNQALSLASNIPLSLAGVIWIYHEKNLIKWKEYDSQAYQE